MFLAKILKIENFRLFDIDTPIDDFEVEKSKKIFFSKKRGNDFFVVFMHKKHDSDRF